MGAEPTLRLTHVYFGEEQAEAQERRVQPQGTRPQNLSLVNGTGGDWGAHVWHGGMPLASPLRQTSLKTLASLLAMVVQVPESSRWHL